MPTCIKPEPASTAPDNTSTPNDSRRFILPTPNAVVTLTMDDGAAIRLRRHGNVDAPIRLLISHGNGFAVDAYYPFWSHLLEHADVIVYDQRNHGWNPRTDASQHDVPVFVNDMEHIIEALPRLFGVRPTIGVFHSISAITAIAHAAAHRWRWQALVVFDPPLIPTPGDVLHDVAHTFELELAVWAEQRPARFSHPDELTLRLQRSRSRARWVEGAHELMARSILRTDPLRGDWALACPPPFESRIYRTNASLDLCPGLAAIPGPLAFIACDADETDAWPPTRVNHAMRHRHGHYFTSIANTDHMLQLERPEACAKAVMELIRDL